MHSNKAMTINGVYLENLIEGYTTLNVVGREMLDIQHDTLDVGVTDGTSFISKRYLPRTLTVSFAIEGEETPVLLRKLDILKETLDVTNAKFIFDDEPDRYYIGTHEGAPQATIALGVVTGSFDILCHDPFKYSVIEHEAEQVSEDDSFIFLDYNGTAKSYPTLETTFNGVCGYASFFNERENIIQIGNPDEESSLNGGNLTLPETLIDHKLSASDSWTPSVAADFVLNNGPKLIATSKQEGLLQSNRMDKYTGTSGTTSGTILPKTKSTSGSPYAYYTVALKSSDRTPATVKLTVVITTSLESSSSKLSDTQSLTGQLLIGGNIVAECIIKKQGVSWSGTTAHTVSKTITISGLTTNVVSISDISFQVIRSDGNGLAARLTNKSCSNFRISTYEVFTNSTYYVSPSNYGSDVTINSGIHGPSITRTLPSDSKGEIGAKNCELTYRHRYSLSQENGTNEVGGFSCILTDSTDKIVAGIRLVKWEAGRYGLLRMYINGPTKVEEIKMNMAYDNIRLGSKGSCLCTIQKIGSSITFNIGGIYRTFTDQTLEDVKVTKVTMMFEQRSASAPLGYNGIYWMRLVKSFESSPNAFAPGDILTADCKGADINLNGVSKPSLGAFGNDWEKFYLKPGVNQIGVSYSDWVEDESKPKFKIYYREVFL